MNVCEKMTIRDLVGACPQTRMVFDRYGLRGCGGIQGPSESIRYFARAHGIDLGVLLHELREMSESPAITVSSEPNNLADTIYRRFFKAGIVTTLTAGAVWGALLLLTLGVRGKFTAISIFDINAHGHAQIFGWVGLFVMGFAYQALPRFKHTSLWRPRWAVMTFYLMVSGLVARVIAEPLHSFAFFRWLGLGASLLELVAIALFIVILCQTYRSSGKPLLQYDYFVGAALFWFLAQAVLDIFHLYMTTTANSRSALLHQVATWQSPLRDLQIHGFAMTMILGVSQRFLPGMFGLPEIDQQRSMRVVKVLTAAVAGEALFFVLFRETGYHLFAGFMYLSMIGLTISVVTLTRQWWPHFWGAPSGISADILLDRTDRSFKFLRIAYAWLFLSLAMLLFVPIYNQMTHQAFSHAFYGATRHAITVGFISLMIMGVSAKVVPVLNGIDVTSLSRLNLPFVLVNVGCGLRVSIQILSDFTPWAFPVIGISGILEVTGISLWAVEVWRVMRRGARGVTFGAETLRRPLHVGPEDKVGIVVASAPELLEVFVNFGFTALRNPALLKTVAQITTIRRACALQHLDETKLLEALNRRLSISPAGPDQPTLVSFPSAVQPR